MMGGSGEAAGLVILEAVLLATAWFVYAIGEAGRQTWMAWKYGNRKQGYKADPFETKLWFGGIFMGFNVLIFGFLR